MESGNLSYKVMVQKMLGQYEVQRSSEKFYGNIALYSTVFLVFYGNLQTILQIFGKHNTLIRNMLLLFLQESTPLVLIRPESQTTQNAAPLLAALMDMKTGAHIQHKCCITLHYIAQSPRKNYRRLCINPMIDLSPNMNGGAMVGPFVATPMLPNFSEAVTDKATRSGKDSTVS